MHFEDDRPIFIQLAEQLENAIIQGVYNGDDQVPSITEYSVAYKINPATALKGVNLLVDAGLLYKKRGVGMFVSPNAGEILKKRRQESFFDEKLMPVVREAKNLEISSDELKNMVERGYENGNRT